MSDRDDSTQNESTRREFLRSGTSLGAAALILGACGGSGGAEPPAGSGQASSGAGAPQGAGGGAPSSTTTSTGGSPSGGPGTGGDGGAGGRPLTPECIDTEDDIEGPYYTAGAPDVATLYSPGMAGTRFTVEGRVIGSGVSCELLAGALLDVWQCDDAGVYDNVGYALRGKFYADAEGKYVFETILPGHYPGRTAHIHIKVSAPGHTLLTTQLYFEGDPQNAADAYYKPELELAPTPVGDGSMHATFDFVIAAS